MANKDTPQGFWPHGEVKQAYTFVAGSRCVVGEFVRMASDGKLDPVAAGETILGLALSTAQADGDSILVSMHPDQLYVGQADETELDAQTDIGNLCDVVATGDSATYDAARMEIDSSTVGTGSGGQLVILGVEDRPDNAFGTNADIVCKINEHQLVTGFAGV